MTKRCMYCGRYFCKMKNRECIECAVELKRIKEQVETFRNPEVESAIEAVLLKYNGAINGISKR